MMKGDGLEMFSVNHGLLTSQHNVKMSKKCNLMALALYLSTRLFSRSLHYIYIIFGVVKI